MNQKKILEIKEDVLFNIFIILGQEFENFDIEDGYINKLTPIVFPFKNKIFEYNLNKIFHSIFNIIKRKIEKEEKKNKQEIDFFKEEFKMKYEKLYDENERLKEEFNYIKSEEFINEIVNRINQKQLNK